MTAPETSAVTWGGERLSYTIRRSPRRKETVAVTLDPGGSVLLAAPVHLGSAGLDESAIGKAPWIVQRLRRAESHARLPGPGEFVSGESVVYLGQDYRLKVHPDDRGAARLRGRWLHVRGAAGARQAAQVRARPRRLVPTARGRKVGRRLLDLVNAVPPRGTPRPPRLRHPHIGSSSGGRRHAAAELGLVSPPVMGSARIENPLARGVRRVT